jgi:hypothetical protein
VGDVVEMTGCSAIMAASGQDALAILVERRPFPVVLDSSVALLGIACPRRMPDDLSLLIYGQTWRPATFAVLNASACRKTTR